MFIDKSHLQTDDAKAVTTATTTVSTNVADLGAGHETLNGAGNLLYYCVSLHGIPDAGNSDETYVFTVQSDTADTMGSPTTVGTVTVPRGTEERMFWTVLPSTCERYVRHSLATGGTSPSITFDSFITTQEPSSWAATADAI